MNLKQLLEDWIGEGEGWADFVEPHNITTNSERGWQTPAREILLEGRNQVRAELRASLPSLLAKIEQHVLEAEKQGYESAKKLYGNSNGGDSFREGA